MRRKGILLSGCRSRYGWVTMIRDGGAFFQLGMVDGAVDGRKIIAVLNMLDMPTVGL